MIVSIIGAGPGGSYLAKLLAEKGHEVTLYEDHPCVGIPVQCTGIVTKKFLDLSPIKKEFLVNEMKKVKIIAPNEQETEIPLYEYVLDRAKLDQYLANCAIDSGAELRIKHRFVGMKNGKALIKHEGKTIEKKTDILVGADGPLSDVAKSAEIYSQRPIFIGHQATIKGNFEKETFTTYFGKLAPGFFAWVVPESDTIARVGLATTQNTQNYFKKFIQEIQGTQIATQAGPIPLFTGKEIVEKDDVYLIGDAAGLAKATTGGGIITAMKSAKILAECLENGKNYTNALKPLRRMLWIHKIIRQTLNKFSDEEYNQLIEMMNKESIKNILATYTREEPAKILPRIIWHEPRFLKFLTKLLF